MPHGSTNTLCLGLICVLMPWLLLVGFRPLTIEYNTMRFCLIPTEADETTFATKEGTFQFNVMPFGLYNESTRFQRLMDVMMSGLNLDICLVHLDDMVLFSKNVLEHPCWLLLLFDRLHKAQVEIEVQFAEEKCEFLRACGVCRGIRD